MSSQDDYLVKIIDSQLKRNHLLLLEAIQQKYATPVQNPNDNSMQFFNTSIPWDRPVTLKEFIFGTVLGYLLIGLGVMVNKL